MNHIRRIILPSLLIVIALYATFATIQYGTTYMTKNYYETNMFRNIEERYIEHLNHYVLNPIDFELTKEALSVSEEEIYYYRYYNGDKVEQINSIESQYEEELMELKEENKLHALKALEQERDAKIEDIKRNFEEDDYVKEKILLVKTSVVENYQKQYSKNQSEFLKEYPYFSYSFKDENGESKERKTDRSAIVRENRLSQVELEGYYLPSEVDFEYTDVENLPYISEGEVKIVERSLRLAEQTTIPLVRNKSTYEGVFYITDDALSKMVLSEELHTFSKVKWILYVVFVSGVLAICTLVYRYQYFKERYIAFANMKSTLSRFPIDVLLLVGVIGFYLFIQLIQDKLYVVVYAGNLTGAHVIQFLVTYFVSAMLIVGVFIGAIYVFTHAIYLYKEAIKKQQKPYLIIPEFVKILGDLFIHRSIGIQTMFIIIVIYLAGCGLFIAMNSSDAFIFYSGLMIIIFIPMLYFLLRNISFLNRIFVQTEKIAMGEIVEPLNIKGNSVFAKHASHINEIQNGVKQSMSEQAKSERLKTELITNVSHDLRTPLTSIITYTNLLKNKQLSEQEQAAYIDIIDRKSERLRILIEDLFEVSKMTSGNVKLQKEKIDIAQLLQQIVGEQMEQFESEQLDLRTSIDSMPLYAYVDAQKMYRVFDNVFTNALKYSMPQTRVYATLTDAKSSIEFTLKNISKYELAGDATELTERFKRADLARHTEGSGLGLAIATSILALHQSTLAIEVDGDLFKLIIKIKKHD